MTSRVEAIVSLKPGAEFAMRGNTLDWLDSKQTKPTNTQIDAETTRLDNLYTAEKYKRDRESAYPSIKEQLDLQYWDQVNGTTKWKESIDKVKSDHPKP